MIAALDKLEGNKKFMLRLIKMEDLLTLTSAETERTGVVMTNGNLMGPPGCQELKLKRELTLKDLALIKRGVDGCRSWQGRFKREVIALSKKLDKMVSTEQASVAWDKLPKKEQKARLKQAQEEKEKES